ncbi:MAG: HD domain-containing protein [Deltaproteobacteria bacterium]|nr:HD domain-containing protein [Deltaproteobacteria bacterium]MBZ0218814.1 HD domain-containing protein [Deltaproteobacteria bacterium]
MSGNEEMEGTGRSDSARSFLRHFEGLASLANDRVVKGVFSAAEARVWLVGGVLRNLALSAPAAPDYDFAVMGDTAAFAKKAASSFGGTPFALDEEAGAYRVVVKGDGAATLDFTPLSPGGIEEDLAKRDFTVNAMAVDLRSLFEGNGKLMDPFGGLDDARAGVLKAVSAGAFDSDPLRMLRAVRLSSQYGLRVEDGTYYLIREKAGLIERSSPERIRDEFKALFANSGTANGISLLYDTGLVNTIIPEISGWPDVDGYDLLSHSLAALREAESILAKMTEEAFPGFSERLREYFSGREGELPNHAILRLAAFFHDTGKPLALSREEGRLRFIGHDTRGAEAVKGLLERLRFSRKTSNVVSSFVANHHRVFMLAGLKERSYRAKGHFFRASGDSGGLLLLCLALADARATRGGEDPELFSVVMEMLDFYFGPYSRKKPKPLLTGDEIMEAFGVEEGPIVGEVIRELNEGVEKGEIRNRKEALKHIRDWLKRKPH